MLDSIQLPLVVVSLAIVSPEGALKLFVTRLRNKVEVFARILVAQCAGPWPFSANSSMKCN